MSDPEPTLTADDLPKVIPLFPLDGALLLPHTSRPFNIFEPRYLNMLDDVMAAERIIGMVQRGEVSRFSHFVTVNHKRGVLRRQCKRGFENSHGRR